MNIREIRQKEYEDKFMNSGLVGILLLSVRMGKTRVALNILLNFINKGATKILVAFPENNISKAWNDEIVTIGFPAIPIEFVNFRSLHKLEGNIYDVVIFDECHELSDAQIESVKKIRANMATLALTGTLNLKNKRRLKNKLKWPVIAEYSFEQAIDDGIIADYKINVHITPLDNKQLIQYKKKKKTEKQQCDAYSFIINKLEEEGKDSKFMRLFRMRLIQKSLAKIKKSRAILSENKGERILVFCGLKEVADSLGIPSEYSGKESGEIAKFADGEGDSLAVVNMASMGVTFKPLDRVVINFTSSNAEDLQQRIARAANLDFVGKIANIDIVCSSEKFEKEWIFKALKPFNTNKILFL